MKRAGPDLYRIPAMFLNKASLIDRAFGFCFPAAARFKTTGCVSTAMKESFGCLMYRQSLLPPILVDLAD
jgi:hypothetical protein